MLSGQARVENSTRSCPRFSPHVRGSHFASKVSYIKPCGRVFNIEILKVSVYDMAASGFVRTFGGGLRRSTVAHFACKVRGTNKVVAKHAQKIQQGHAPDFRHASVSLINSCFNSIKHPIRFHGNSKTLHPSSEGLYYLSTRGRE